MTTRLKLDEVEQYGAKEAPKETTGKAPSESAFKKMALTILVFVIAIAAITLVGILVFRIKIEGLYWVALLGGLALALASFIRGSWSVEPAEKIAKTAVWIAVIAMVVFTIWPSSKKLLNGSDNTVVATKTSTGAIDWLGFPSTARNVVLITGPGAPSLELQPGQSTDSWYDIGEGLVYSFTSNGPGFFIKYQRGDTVQVQEGRDRVPIPSRAGPFKVQAGEKPVRVTLLVSKLS